MDVEEYSVRLVSLISAADEHSEDGDGGDRTHYTAIASVSPTEEAQQAVFVATALVLSNRSYEGLKERQAMASRLLEDIPRVFAELLKGAVANPLQGTAFLVNSSFLLACDVSISYLLPELIPPCDRTDQQVAADAVMASSFRPSITPPSFAEESPLEEVSHWSHEALSSVSTTVLLLLFVVSLAFFFAVYRLCFANKALTDDPEDRDVDSRAVEERRLSSHGNGEAMADQGGDHQMPHSPATSTASSTSSTMGLTEDRPMRSTSMWPFSWLWGEGRGESAKFTALAQHSRDEEEEEEEEEGGEDIDHPHEVAFDVQQMDENSRAQRAL